MTDRLSLLLLTRYAPLGASSRIRMLQYMPALAAAGIDVVTAPLFDEVSVKRLYEGGGYSLPRLVSSLFRRLSWLRRSRRFDLIWLEYELLPWLPAMGEWLLARTGPPFVVEYDDAVFHRYDHHRSAIVRALLGRKIDAVMRRATAVVAGNEYLAARAREAGAHDVTIVPSVVDLRRYVPQPSRSTTPTIGWIGSPSTAPYLDAVSGALARVSASERVRTVIVGAEPGRTAWTFPVEERKWSLDDEVATICDFDIGIMPLADDVWARGKCGFKLVQYMACAKPVVASPVGVNQRIVEAGVHGLLASRPDEWVEALTALLRDPAMRVRMGRAGRERIEREYALDVTAPRIVDVMHRAAGVRLRARTRVS